MKFNRLSLIALLIFVLLNAGCAGIDVSIPHVPLISEQERNLTEALARLRAGNEPQARDLLEKVADGVPAAGVTDEALFRLALLDLTGRWRQRFGAGANSAGATCRQVPGESLDKTICSAPFASRRGEGTA